MMPFSTRVCFDCQWAGQMVPMFVILSVMCMSCDAQNSTANHVVTTEKVLPRIPAVKTQKPTPKPKPKPDPAVSRKVLAAEKVCDVDSDCVLVSAGCCPCSAAGRNEAINTKYRQALQARRTQTCKEILCAQMISQDPSCQATGAKCDKGQCLPHGVPTQGPPAFGVGVEKIKAP